MGFGRFLQVLDRFWTGSKKARFWTGFGQVLDRFWTGFDQNLDPVQKNWTGFDGVPLVRGP